LSFDGGVVWVIVIGITGKYGVVVVRLVLNERVEPTIANEDVLEVDLVRSGDILRVLPEEVLCEKSDWDHDQF
jgi:hypothetical protein